MGYPNQDRCIRCGLPIPEMPEDATPDERLCEACYECVAENELKGDE